MLLKVEGVCKYFGGLKAVDQVDFSVNEGEIMAIIGPNGAGKTTLFNVMSGMLKPTAGKIIFKDENISAMKPYHIVSKGIARTFQTTTLFDQLRVMDNLAIGNRSRTRTGFWDALLRTPRWKKDRDDTVARVLEVAGFIGLGNKLFDPVETLSQEEQKRLSIGVALASKPDLLLLDEPTGGVNTAETDEIMELIRKIKEQGTTICLIEHKMRMVMGLADRIVVLNYGKKIAEGTPEEIKNNDEVIKAYLGGEEVA